MYIITELIYKLCYIRETTYSVLFLLQACAIQGLQFHRVDCR